MQTFPFVSGAAALSFVALKLVLPPALICLATWVSRRWGPRAAGWIVGLPHTSGPVVLSLALERGPAFAADACAGVTLALGALALWAVVYAWAARWWGWLGSATIAALAYLAVLAPLRLVHLSLEASFGVACLALAVALRAMPRDAHRHRATPSRKWDVPLRMAVAVILVCSLTWIAVRVGPQLGGLLTPFPVAATMLTAFMHREQGSAAANHLLRGLLTGLYSFAVFFLTAGALLRTIDVGVAFGLATAAALFTNAIVALAARGHVSLDSPPHPMT